MGRSSRPVPPVRGTHLGRRGVIAVGFSRSEGGEYLTAVNSDNGHTVRVWNWTKHGDDAVMDNAVEVPGWCFGPAKRVDGLGAFYTKVFHPSPGFNI